MCIRVSQWFPIGKGPVGFTELNGTKSGPDYLSVYQTPGDNAPGLGKQAKCIESGRCAGHCIATDGYIPVEMEARTIRHT